MGCGDACPLLPRKYYEDWELDDPSSKTIEQIRPIRDELKNRVTSLLHQLGSASADTQRSGPTPAGTAVSASRHQ